MWASTDASMIAMSRPLRSVSSTFTSSVVHSVIAASPAGRMAPPEEIAIAAAFLLGPDSGFVTGSDLLIDGGVIAAMRAGKLPPPV